MSTRRSADEPTGNLDPTTAQSVLDLLRETVATEKLTLILVTHDPGVAAQSDRHITLRDGRVVGDDRLGTRA
jgi:ABC-type lipoprotein export system ATPase subunit